MSPRKVEYGVCRTDDGTGWQAFAIYHDPDYAPLDWDGRPAAYEVLGYASTRDDAMTLIRASK